MPSILPMTPSVPHVPAWKRLGLKLKYAKDHVGEDVKVKQVNGNRERKRKRTAVEAERTKESLATDIERPLSSPSTPIFSSQKSVSFTPDTKTEDGESTRQLFQTWTQEQKAKDSTFQPEKLGEAFRSVVSEATVSTEPTPTKKTKSRKGKSAGGKAGDKAPKDQAYIGPLLAYLLQHHQSRASWKFNKAKQTHLMRHLFDYSHIPAQHDPALAGYIAGLQGDAVRRRVREAARAILNGDDEIAAERSTAMQTDVEHKAEEKKAASEDGFRRPEPARESPDPAKALRRHRADAILCALVQSSTSTATAPPATPPPPPGQPKRVKLNDGSSAPSSATRKRKLRASVDGADDAGYETSSSGSDSGSESGTSSSGNGSSVSDSSDEDEDDDTSSSSSSSSSGTDDVGSDAETTSSSSSSSASGGSGSDGVGAAGEHH